MAEQGTDPKGALPAAQSREAYIKPTIAWEEPLEDRPNLMAACAQHPLEQGPCDSSPYS